MARTSTARPSTARCARPSRSAASCALGQAETGAGKEIIASHYAAESGRPHIKRRNCANFQKDLAEAELFGAVRGAYMGAHRDRAGAFEEAHRGVLFLDELAEIGRAHV